MQHAPGRMHGPCWYVVVLGIVVLEHARGPLAAQAATCGCEARRSVLEEFYEATDGAHWVVPWNLSAPVCGWHGLTCSASGDVSILDLTDNGLRGTLPLSLGDLAGLGEFGVKSNHLNGTLPRSLKQWTMLTRFDVADNRFDGTLPPDFGDWTLLERFLVFDNRFNGTIPSAYGDRWLHIVGFEVHHNNLAGTLDTSWSKWIGLSSLQLDHNRFGGTLPESFKALHKLKHFTMSTNAIHGTLPTSYSSWTLLERFVVRVNALSGSLPASYSAWAAIEEFAVGRNELSGPLPSDYGGAWGRLRVFAADKNTFSGTLPESFGGWVNVTSFDVSNNGGIEGTLPVAYGSWQRLEKFVVDSNRIVGSLPSAYKSWASVTYVSVGRNQLTGPLPPEYWQWQSIRTIAAFGNKFNGTLPAVWGYMTQLTDLYLHDNVLEGTLPSEYFGLGSLGLLWLAGNRLSGTVPESWGNLRLVDPDLPVLGILLQNNSFTGTIPPSWAQMIVQPTTLISICHTNLCGDVPTTIQQRLLFLVCLNNLDLSIDDPLALQAAMGVAPFATPQGQCRVPSTTTAAPPPSPTNGSARPPAAFAPLHTYVVVAPLGGALVGSVVAGALSLGTLMRCADDAGAADPEPSSDGAVWMACMCVGACVACYGAAMAVSAWTLRCRGATTAAGRRFREHHAADGLRETFVAWRLPGRLGPLIGSLSPLLLETCIPLLASSTGNGQTTGIVCLCVGCVLLAWPYVCVTMRFGATFKRTTHNGNGLCGGRDGTGDKDVPSPRRAARCWPRVASWASSIAEIVFPTGNKGLQWVAQAASPPRPHFVAEYGVLFEDCVGGRQWYFAVECGFAVATSVLAGVAATAEVASATTCNALRYAIGAVNVFAYLLFIALRVFSDRSVALTAAALGGLSFVGGVLLLVPDCDSCFIGAEVAMETQLWLTLAICAVDVWRAFRMWWGPHLRRCWPSSRTDDVDPQPVIQRVVRRHRPADLQDAVVAEQQRSQLDAGAATGERRNGRRRLGTHQPHNADRQDRTGALAPSPMYLEAWQHQTLAALVDMICDGRCAQ